MKKEYNKGGRPVLGKGHVRQYIVSTRLDTEHNLCLRALVRESGQHPAEIVRQLIHTGTVHERMRRERLREPDKTKYEIYDAIRGCLRGCRSWDDLEKRLQEQGITTRYKFCGTTDRKQGVLFSKNGLEFSGSKIDRAFSFSKLDHYFTQQQHRAMLVDNLGKVAENYRSVFTGLFGNMGGKTQHNIGSVDLGGGIGTIPLPSNDSPVGLSAAQMQRRQGESPEEHIARITALLREVVEAILTATEERKRKLRSRKINTPKMKL